MDSMKTKLFFAIALLLVFPVAVLAIPITADFSGTRSTSDGSVFAADGWSGAGNKGFQIEWEISFDGANYNYEYTISGQVGTDLSKALSHWILEVTNPSLKNEFSNVSPSFAEAPKTYTPASGNPEMPGDLYGIKWDTSGDPLVYTVTFTTA
jgi:hypothetical protein